MKLFFRAHTFLSILPVIAISILTLTLNINAAPVSHDIKLDHFGYRTSDTKIAIISTNPGSSVEIRNTSDQIVFSVPANGGSITSKGNDGAPSGDDVWWVDFSSFNTPGTYRVFIPSLNDQSYDFEIRDDIYNNVVLTALKTFYLQRCNTPKDSQYAGSWSDGSSCHMQDLTTGPASGHANHGTLDLTGGWHDAGDYNKYVWKATSSAILFMLRAFEDNPGVFKDNDLNIPESGNGTPDILDEIKWELDWLLKMQISDGSVLYQMHVDGFASDAPPSVDTNVRFYQNPNIESASVFAGTLALAARIYGENGMTTYANTLQTAAEDAWTWLLTQPDNKEEERAWAAAEIFRTNPTITSARDYVDNFDSNNWSGRFFNPARYDSHAAITYIQTPQATQSVVANMKQDVSNQVNYIFSTNDLYRNGLPDWAYHWGSNLPRAATGIFLLNAVKLGETGSHSVQETQQHAQDFLHFFHGQNPLNMVYMTNMTSHGGEHSSFQFYHAWYGDTFNAYSLQNFIGKPNSINEPDYPYYKGTDNLGVSDNKVSSLGPPPGFVPGGPNKDYSGTANPPGNSVFYNLFYRDWNDQTGNDPTDWQARTWEITENSIGYQGTYVGLGAYFMSAQATGCQTDTDCDDGLFCNGSETCDNGSCQSGTDPCPGQSCDEQLDICFTPTPTPTTSPTPVPICNNNGTCDGEETCDNCPNDCISGSGSNCGNGICEAGDGEDCLSCPADCRGKQNGNPRNRYCCGDGDGSNPLSCSDNTCTTNGFQCTDNPAEPYCCGDNQCTGAEDSSSCELDCGPAPFCGDNICDADESICSCSVDCGTPAGSELSCTDGGDDDCDGSVDCDDSDCSGDPACATSGCDNDNVCESGEDCNNCPNDCSGVQKGKPSNRYCCGDGTAQSAEGNGSICDGNF